MTSYIPERARERWGVISDWPYLIKELIEELDPGQGRITFERLSKRKLIDGTPTWIESEAILCKFQENYIPTRLALYDGKFGLKVKPYIKNVKICFNCLKLGHIKNKCRDTKKKCYRCAEEYHGECDREVRCNNCNGQHRTQDKTCPAFLKEKDIMKIMAYENKSFEEARRIWETENIETTRNRPQRRQQLNKTEYMANTRREEEHSKKREFWENIGYKNRSRSS